MTDLQARYVIADLPAKGARLWPDRPALAWDSARQQRSWAELDDRASRLITVLRRAGARAGSRVGILSSNCPEFFELFFACARMGAVMVPLNTRLAIGEVAHQVADADMVAVIVDPDCSSILTGSEAVTRLEIGDRLDATLAAAERCEDEAARDDHVTVMQMYTSGTTGTPKGCLQTSYGWLQSALGFSQVLRLPEGAILVAGAPYFHSFGFGLALAHLLVGGTVGVISGLDRDDYWPMVDACRPHTVIATGLLPAELTPRESVRVMLGQAGQYRSELGMLRDRVFPNAAYAGVYGLTEATNIVMISSEECEQQIPGDLGRPLPGMDVRVARLDQSPTSPGETGELLLRSSQLSVGYWRDDEATHDLFEGGWLHTGDLAVQDADGRIRFADRRKDMIKTGGENVYSAEVERVLLASGLVTDVAVYGVPDPRWSETVVAMVVIREHGPDTIAALDAHCREQIAGYKRPRLYEIVDQIPRNETNKVRKAHLRAAHDQARCIRP